MNVNEDYECLSLRKKKALESKFLEANTDTFILDVTWGKSLDSEA